MSLTSETGAGITGAESYASIAQIDAYWTNRPHHSLAATWAAASTANKEGAAREATGYLDATYGPFYRGQRRSYIQGLEWPRAFAKDENEASLKDLPDQLVWATAELAARSISGPLADDVDRGGQISEKTERIEGAISETTKYATSAIIETRYGFLDGMIEPLLNGMQPSSMKPNWSFA